MVASTHLELAKRSFAAFKRGDADAYVASFAPDVQWEVSAFVTGRSDYRGREGVREFLAELDRLSRDQGEEFKVELDEFEEVDDDRVLALGNARIDRAADPLEFEAGALYTFAGHDIIRLEGYTSHVEAREAAGFE